MRFQNKILNFMHLKIFSVFMLLMSISFTVKAQECDTLQSPVMKAYNDYMNYTPKSLQGLPVPEFFGDWKPDNLITLSLLYKIKDRVKLEENQSTWLNTRVNDLAVGFYLEGNPVLLGITGGYHGCPEREYELKKEVINGKQVTIFNFCHSCTGQTKGENEFIEIFNNRTKRLIEAGR